MISYFLSIPLSEQYMLKDCYSLKNTNLYDHFKFAKRMSKQLNVKYLIVLNSNFIDTQKNSFVHSFKKLYSVYYEKNKFIINPFIDDSDYILSDPLQK